MARLNEGCEVFIASLEKAQAELDFVANRLEEEFATRSKGGAVNPLDLLQRIHRLRNDLPVLAQECAEVLEAKQECVDAAKHYLTANTEEVGRLQRRAGITEDGDGGEAMQAFLGAVDELEAKLRLGAPGEAAGLSRAELNEAVVSSVVA